MIVKVNELIPTVHPPTPVPAQGYTLDNPPRVTHSPASGTTTPERAGTDNDEGVETISRDFAEKGSIKDEKGDRRSVALSSRKSLKRHLHLPGSRGLGNGQPNGKSRIMPAWNPLIDL